MMRRCSKRTRKERKEEDDAHVEVGNNSSPQALKRAGDVAEATVKHALAEGVTNKMNKTTDQKKQKTCVTELR